MKISQGFELNSIKAQESLNYKGISQLKVSVAAAKELHKDNGLDELYFRADGKDYVAFGQGMSQDALNSPIPATFNGARAEIIDFSDEANTAWEGTKEIFSTIKGRLATAVGIAGGGMLGTHIINKVDMINRAAVAYEATTLSSFSKAMSTPTISEFGKFKVAAKSAIIIGGAAALGTAAYGAYSGATAKADYQSIHHATTGLTFNPSGK